MSPVTWRKKQTGIAFQNNHWEVIFAFGIERSNQKTTESRALQVQGVVGFIEIIYLFQFISGSDRLNRGFNC